MVNFCEYIINSSVSECNANAKMTTFIQFIPFSIDFRAEKQLDHYFIMKSV